jgi:hypothetical protein
MITNRQHLQATLANTGSFTKLMLLVIFTEESEVCRLCRLLVVSACSPGLVGRAG